MEYHTSEIKAGVFITSAVAVLIIGIIKVGDVWNKLIHDYQYFSAHFKEVQLLKEGAPVTLAGWRVGQVAVIRRGVGEKGKSQVQVIVKLQDDVEVDTEAKLVVMTYGLLGEPGMALKPGNGTRREGGTLAAPADMGDGVTPSGMQELMDSGSSLLGKLSKSWDESVDPALRSVKEAVSSEDASKNLLTRAGKLIDDADTAVNQAKALIEENRPDLKKITSELAGKIEGIAAKLDKLLADADSVMVHADGILTDNDRNIYETIANLKDTTYHMKQFAKKVEADPSTLIFGSKPVEESTAVRDETEWRLKGRTGPYLQEVRAQAKDATKK